MPELPEVEHASRQLQSWMLGRRIESASAESGVMRRKTGQQIFQTSLSETSEEAIFANFFPGKVLGKVMRHGKNLFLFFQIDKQDSWILHVHFGMTGKFLLRPREVPEPYSRFQWNLENKNTIHFRDPRKFGYCSLFKSQQGFSPIEAKWGPDLWLSPLNGQELGRRLVRVRRPVKIALMEQEIVAGLGNIQAAEALFRAGINPQRKADQLVADELTRLVKGIQETLEYSLSQLPALSADIEYVEDPGARNPFLVYGKTGQPCPRCNTIIESFRQNGRTTYWCPKCQT
jgi:formamidopyrimidine-DNA glycosylase